ncbi:MAG: AmmeMemoRadiSam system protein B [Candidatus Acidiferrum sp.]
MLRLPAVAGQFYPDNPLELTALVDEYTKQDTPHEKVKVRACLVPHAGYMYSGGVAGAVFSRILLPKKILLLGVRHYPRGEALAILSEGAWRTPLGDVPVETPLAVRLRKECPALREDSVAHSREHSLEVELPFLQVLDPGFSFVPVAVGTLRFEDLVETGEGIARVLEETQEEILIVTSSDMNHYEDDTTTRRKDRKAIECMLKVDAKGLYNVCRDGEISMCGLGPAVTMLTAIQRLSLQRAELVRYATSGDVSGDRDAVVGYAGMIFG